jgi:hypothetical protein
MSSKQIDSHNDRQERIFQEFDSLVSQFRDELVSYDQVEEELDMLRDDDECDTYTYEKCKKLWDQQIQDESFWQEEDRQMWEQLRDDSGI